MKTDIFNEILITEAHQTLILVIFPILDVKFKEGLGNVRPAGHIRPAKHLNVARELRLKFSN
jgi:hypothetical protein